eukprot:7092096-Pyramimonas_sp.AAC.2
MRLFLSGQVGLAVDCGGVRGWLMPGGRRGEEWVQLHKRDRSGNAVVISAPEFEARGGLGHRKKWRESVTVCGKEGADDVRVG